MVGQTAQGMEWNFLSGYFLAQPIGQLSLGADDELLGLRFSCELDHALGRSDLVGHVYDLRTAFGVDQDDRLGMLPLQLPEVLGR